MTSYNICTEGIFRRLGLSVSVPSQINRQLRYYTAYNHHGDMESDSNTAKDMLVSHWENQQLHLQSVFDLSCQDGGSLLEEAALCGRS